MIPKSGNRFSDKIMRLNKGGMIPKSGNRFSDKIMRSKNCSVAMMVHLQWITL